MSFPLERLLPPLFFLVAGFPLVWQDLRDESVSLGLLLCALVAWSVFASLWERSPDRFLAAGIVLVAGSVLLITLPGRLGEADVVFMSGIALLLPFRPMLISFALACIGALSAFAWFARDNQESLAYPMPFLPSLYWGGLSVMVGGILI